MITFDLKDGMFVDLRDGKTCRIKKCTQITILIDIVTDEMIATRFDYDIYTLKNRYGFEDLDIMRVYIKKIDLFNKKTSKIEVLYERDESFEFINEK